MADQRSDDIYWKWRESTEKFDYFILGATGALFAFISEKYTPEKIDANPGTLELSALFVLVLAAIAGFKRVEYTILVTSINHKELYANENRGALVANSKGGPVFNHSTGEILSESEVKAEIANLTQKITQLQSETLPIQENAKQAYRCRNILLLVGFLTLLAAKLWRAYT